MTGQTYQDLRDQAQQMTDRQLQGVMNRQNGAPAPAPGPGGAIPEGDPLAPFANEELQRREPLGDPYLDG